MSNGERDVLCYVVLTGDEEVLVDERQVVCWW